MKEPAKRPAAVEEARKFFPRGLTQPEASFRFSLDALLLGSFAQAAFRGWKSAKGGSPPRLLDLGCSCGVAAFAVMMGGGDFQALGLDREPGLVEAARRNAANLGLAERFEAACLDLERAFPAEAPLEAPGFLRQGAAAELWPTLACGAGGFDLIIANPPYRLIGRGRLPASRARRAALFAGPENLPAFVGAAGHFLAPSGLFCLIFPWERLEELLMILEARRLAACATLPVRTKAGQNVKWALLAACPAARLSNAVAGFQSGLPEDLTLYESAGGSTRLRPEALDFCSYLRPENPDRAG